MQTELDLAPRDQQILDRWVVIERIYRTPPRARCPLCGRVWRSAPWIARVRARRHTLTKHGRELQPFQLAI